MSIKRKLNKVMIVLILALIIGGFYALQASTLSGQLSSIDQNWNLYHNDEYGFSMKVPKKILNPYYNMLCGQKVSLAIKNKKVPVKVFEGKSVYISTGYYFDEVDGKGCSKVKNSLAHIHSADYFQNGWQLIFAEVNNDVELEDFIKENYGFGGCRLGNKVPSEQVGVFDISILSDGKEPSESNCFINYNRVIKYYPKRNIVVSWHLGQESRFFADEKGAGVYDQEMINSFTFNE